MVSAVSWRFSRKVSNGVVGITGPESEEHFGGGEVLEREKSVSEKRTTNEVK